MLTESKDEQYHVDFARYFVGQANNHFHSEFIEKIRMNKEFYKGNQWQNDEDLEAFFKDDTGQSRNRIKIIKNLIRPMVEQYRGNAVRMQINAKLKSTSSNAVSRRETKLEEMTFYSKIANQPENPYAADMKSRLPIGNSESETQQIFDAYWVDRYVETMNDLLEYVAELNRFASKQVHVAENLALSGLAVMKTFEYAGHQRFSLVPTENFFWDRSAREYDLSDSEYEGEYNYYTPSEVFELGKNMTSAQRKGIENFANKYSPTAGAINPNDQNHFYGRVPVVDVYWRDTDHFEFGYVRDEFGYPIFTMINFTHEGEEGPRYTDDDLIKVNTAKSRKILKGKMKRDMYVDTLRFVSFVPKEFVAYDSDEKEKQGDVIIDYGVAEYQETDGMDFDNVKFPYKCYAWGYLDGEVLSPIDDAINPQRFINRVLSVAENQINNSRGSGMIYDKQVVDPQDGEAGMLRKMNQSQPVGVVAKGKGIQNVTGQYDGTVGKGTMVMFNIVDIMKGHIQDTTGVNEALKGESTGSDQLVGVTQLLIQRGSLMQEPFYNAIAEIFLQCYQSVASFGKRLYADNESTLTMAVGDAGYKKIKITEDMKAETFRCFVKRESPDDVLINAGNQMLLAFAERNWIDQERMSMLWGRSTPDQISAALREKVKEDKEVARIQKREEDAEESQLIEQANMEQEEIQSQMYEQQAREDIKDISDKKFKMKEVFAKQLGNLAKTDPEARNQILQKTKDLENNLV
jgi:hypothetical protein